MVDPMTLRLGMLLCGAIPAGLGLVGLYSGWAFLPTNRYAGKEPWVSRCDEPGSYWAIVVVQMGCGLLLATSPYWRPYLGV